MWPVIITSAGTIFVLALVFALGWKFGKRDYAVERARTLQRSAEQAADASTRHEIEIRRTANAIESVDGDTPVSVGNRLLSGATDNDARPATNSKK